MYPSLLNNRTRVITIGGLVVVYHTTIGIGDHLDLLRSNFGRNLRRYEVEVVVTKVLRTEIIRIVVPIIDLDIRRVRTYLCGGESKRGK